MIRLKERIYIGYTSMVEYKEGLFHTFPVIYKGLRIDHDKWMPLQKMSTIRDIALENKKIAEIDLKMTVFRSATDASAWYTRILHNQLELSEESFKIYQEILC